MAWWNRLINKAELEKKVKDGEKLNRKERRLVELKGKYKQPMQLWAGSIAKGRTLNPFAVKMANDWRKKHGVN